MADGQHNAIITGGASGLGRAIALRLARDGWNIAICDINDEPGAQVVEEVKAAGGDARFEHLDVTSVEHWEQLSHRLREDWQTLDLLVNNAGVAASGNMGEAPLEDWRWIVDINLFNGIYGCHTFVDWLKANPRGSHIINTASLAAIAVAPSMASYNVTKAGMLALSETLYAELKQHNVGVTVLCPAFFATNLLKEGRFHEQKLRDVAESAFRKATLTAEQVADEAVRAMHRKQLYVILPPKARWYWRYKRLAPQRFLDAIARMSQKGPRDSI